jgi:cytochrome c oxidase assembly protein subunit 11
MGPHRRRRNTFVVVGLVAVVVGMAGLSFAAVPLYRLFCQVTGFGGTTQSALAAPGAVGERVITVQFNADVSPALPWRFQPVQRKVKVRVGARSLARYRAENLSDTPLTGVTTFNVTPYKAGVYFKKIECFCFTEQSLAAGESVEMPVTFFIDPEIVNDRNLDDVTIITLSYTFFRAKNAGEKRAASEGAGETGRQVGYGDENERSGTVRAN